MSRFLPFERMRERVEFDRRDSDVATFYSLMFYGEFALKATVLGMTAAIQEDRDRNRYRLLHGVVRSDGLGAWTDALDDILTGPASQRLHPSARHEQKQLTQLVRAESWQHRGVTALHSCFEAMGIESPSLGQKLAGRQWYRLFAELRNKTRGHGAPKGGQCSRVCTALSQSIDEVVDHLGLFERPWAVIQRNMSGKYRVTPLTESDEPFTDLRRSSAYHLPNGTYVAFDQILSVDLFESDIDVTDFLVANGAFDGKQFELLSYITNDRRKVTAEPFLSPVESLPASETEGRGSLEAVGECLANLPGKSPRYVPRPEMEERVLGELMLERHPIVTLTGAGGIGKTSLALEVLHRLAASDCRRYDLIIWLSARDIDLQPGGPKRVRPDVLSLEDVSKLYVRLVSPSSAPSPGVKPNEALATGLSSNTLGPTLFVFDNFETLTSPVEVFSWIDTYIRPPNKVLITTRVRDFRGDYSLDVPGMTEKESGQLIREVAGALGIGGLLTPSYIEEVFRESHGHPYVMKILLGEMAKAGRHVKPERIVATQEEMLAALFERTFAHLTPAAQKVFLILCNWRSLVAEPLLLAVLLRPENERVNVEAALEELTRSSLIEGIESPRDGQTFYSVPLAAMAFGRRKLSVSPMKAAVEVDTKLLQEFGPAVKGDIRGGVLPRIQWRLRQIASGPSPMKQMENQYSSMFEFLAQRVPPVWLDLADFYVEFGGREGIARAKVALRRFLESPDRIVPNNEVWRRLANLCRQDGDASGEVQALVEMSDSLDVPLSVVSSAANRINEIHRALRRLGASAFDSQERRVLIRRVAEAMDRRSKQCDATDYSRLAWLYLQLGDEPKARALAERGLQLEADNYYCRSLFEKIRKS